MSDLIPFAVSGDLTRLSHELEFVLRTLNVLERGNPITRAQLELIVCAETPPPPQVEAPHFLGYPEALVDVVQRLKTQQRRGEE